MTWQQEWKAISARIKGIQGASEPLIQAFAKNDQDETGSSTVLYSSIDDMKGVLKEFAKQYKLQLPQKAVTVIEDYCNQPAAQAQRPMARLTGRLSRIIFLQSEVDYHLSDFAEIIKRQSERAFLHLQQCIVADTETQTRWDKAFNRHETACEKLGAAHLLLHGIYAFKADIKGERTDLVFPDRPIQEGDIARVADGLVLTEWKIVKKPSDAQIKAEEARKQAEQYSAGALGGFELATYRYIVLVSSDRLSPIPDHSENGIIYHHVNIAVSPSTPSVSAKQN